MNNLEKTLYVIGVLVAIAILVLCIYTVMVG